MRNVRNAFPAMVLALALSLEAAAHCDTLDGPVVKDARAALERGDVTVALKWVGADREAQVREAFRKTLAVRKQGAEARDLADTWFFETLVRLHREGEGAPYTGLKPAGTPLEAGVAEADKALDAGQVEALVKAATDAVAAGIRQRYAKAAEARAHAAHNVEAGRRFVAAYVEFVHHVEAIFAAAKGAGGHGHAAHDDGHAAQGATPAEPPHDHH